MDPVEVDVEWWYREEQNFQKTPFNLPRSFETVLIAPGEWGPITFKRWIVVNESGEIVWEEWSQKVEIHEEMLKVLGSEGTLIAIYRPPPP